MPIVDEKVLEEMNKKRATFTKLQIEEEDKLIKDLMKELNIEDTEVKSEP